MKRVRTPEEIRDNIRHAMLREEAWEEAQDEKPEPPTVEDRRYLTDRMDRLQAEANFLRAKIAELQAKPKDQTYKGLQIEER